jgi:hypothetical protein
MQRVATERKYEVSFLSFTVLRCNCKHRNEADNPSLLPFSSSQPNAQINLNS